jgi:integrase
MATIEKRANLQWRAKVRRKGFPPQSATFATKGTAVAWARQIETEMDRGVFVSRLEAERTTLAEALDRYEQEVTPAKKGWKQEVYRIGFWRNHPLAARSLASIRSSDLAQWRDERLKQGYSPITVRNDVNLISHVFTIAIKEWGMDGLINPVAQIRKPRLPPGRDRRLEDGEEDRLMEACRAYRSPWLAPVVQIALETGMRLGEIMGLRWPDVNLRSRVARLNDTKNGTRRDVPLSSHAVATLEALPRSLDGRVFPIAAETVKKAYHAAVERAGIEDLRFHDLRHEATSRFFERGLDMMEVAAITGHKTLAMLKRYTHLRAADLARKLG